MTITITNGTQTVTVAEILGWSTSRSSANLVHTIIGRRDHDVTLGELGLRSGTCRLLCSTLGEAASLEVYFATKGVHTIADTQIPQVGMRFVIRDTVDVELDETTSLAAVVSFGFQEVIL